MKHNPHTLINVQALAEPQRAKHRREVYFCYKAGMTKYAGSAEVRLCAMVFKGDKGIRATRVRHVHLAPHGAPVHAEYGLHLSVSGEGRKGAESGSREEMAGNGLPRHKEESVRRLFHKKEVRYAAD